MPPNCEDEEGEARGMITDERFAEIDREYGGVFYMIDPPRPGEPSMMLMHHALTDLLAEVKRLRPSPPPPPRPSPGASAEDAAREAKRVEEIRREMQDPFISVTSQEGADALIRYVRDLLAILDARAARESERERVAEGVAKALEGAVLSVKWRYNMYSGYGFAEFHDSEAAAAMKKFAAKCDEALAAYRAQRPETETRT